MDGRLHLEAEAAMEAANKGVKERKNPTRSLLCSGNLDPWDLVRSGGLAIFSNTIQVW